MPYLSFLFICCVWGASFILMDRALLAFGPVAIAVFRMLGGAAVLGMGWLIARRQVKLSRVDWMHILVVAIGANALPFVVQPFVMDRADEHAYFGMMIVLVPLATILASIPMLGIWPTTRQLIGVLIGLVCMAGVVFDGTQRGIGPELLVLALTVPVSYALGNTYIKWKLDHLPPLPLTTLFLGLGGMALLPLLGSPTMLTQTGLGGPETPTDWLLATGSVALLSVLGTGITILMFIHLVKDQGPLFAGMVTYVVPVLALVWGQYDGELLTWNQMLAVAGVLGSVALVQWNAVGAARSLPDPLLE